jgi:hypothetical protein
MFTGLFARISYFNKCLLDIAKFFRSRDVKRLSYANVETSSHFFQKFEILNCFNKDFLIPSDTENYLKIKYGETWKTPRKEWNYLEEDGGIVSIT